MRGRSGGRGADHLTKTRLCDSERTDLKKCMPATARCGKEAGTETLKAMLLSSAWRIILQQRQRQRHGHHHWSPTRDGTLSVSAIETSSRTDSVSACYRLEFKCSIERPEHGCVVRLPWRVVTDVVVGCKERREMSGNASILIFFKIVLFYFNEKCKTRQWILRNYLSAYYLPITGLTCP